MVCCGDNRVEPSEGKKAAVPGPYRERSCTDLFFLILFLAFWGGMVGIAYVALTDGDPNRLINGYDSFGNVCGEKNDPVISSANSGLDMTDRKFVFFYNIGNGDALRLCVSSCPFNATNVTNSEYCVSQSPYSFLDGDRSRVSRSSFNLDSDGCPSVVGSSYFTLLSRCVPVDTSSIVSYFQGQDIVTQVSEDLNNSWREMLYMCIVAVVIALLMVALMSVFATIIIWTTYILAFVCCIGAIGYMWHRWYELDQDYQETAPEYRLDSQKENVNFYYNGGIVVTVVLGIVLLILIVLRSRLALLVAIFREAGRAIRKMPFMLLFPFLTFTFVMLNIVYFIAVYVFLYTAADASENAIGHVVYTNNDDLRYMQWYHVFGFLWAVQLVFAIQEFVLAGAVSRWYFASDKSSLGWPIAASIKNAFRYHLGTLAFGALIIALVQFARLILAYVQRKLEGKAGPVVNFLLKCCSCCLWLLEKVLKFINRNAYIEVAIFGHSFCKAAREAFGTLFRNVFCVATINSVGSFVFFLSRLVVVGTVAFGSMHWFEQELDLVYPAVPIFVVCLVAWIISGIFTGVYDMTIDTVFLCFAEDSERNDGSIERPLFASDRLIKFMDKIKVVE